MTTFHTMYVSCSIFRLCLGFIIIKTLDVYHQIRNELSNELSKLFPPITLFMYELQQYLVNSHIPEEP